MKIISTAAIAFCLAAVPALAQPAMNDAMPEKKLVAGAMKPDAMMKADAAKPGMMKPDAMKMGAKKPAKPMAKKDTMSNVMMKKDAPATH
jgi:hypothetical protein